MLYLNYKYQLIFRELITFFLELYEIRAFTVHIIQNFLMFEQMVHTTMCFERLNLHTP
jgi:hypothetical protein